MTVRPHRAHPSHPVSHPAPAAAQFSKAEIDSLKKYFDENGFDNLQGKSLGLKDLKGDAAADFKTFQKGMVDDYPSEAMLTKVQGKEIIVVQENNDGGSYYGFYAMNGKRLASGSCSESGDPTWDR